MSQITVLGSKVVTPEGKKYRICELSYKTEEGKVKGMRIFGFGDQKAVFDVAAQTEKGDVLNATFRQNEKGYWEFGSLEVTGEKRSTSSEASVSEGKSGARAGNWETAEERAARQVYIVRQSSIASAVALVEANKAKASPKDIIAMAMEFEAFVMGKPAAQTGEVQ